MKRLLTNVKVAFAVAFGTLVLKGLYLTFRSYVVNYGDGFDAKSTFEQPRVIVFWHNGQIIMVISAKELFGHLKRRKIYTLISPHSDGRIIASVARRFKIDSVAGSSSKRGGPASRELVEKALGGSHVAITPDGPRGPVYEMKPGAVRISQLSGAWIVPLGVAADRCWRLKSWDRMIVPKPFARIALVVGAPIEVPEQLEGSRFDEIRMKVEEQMNSLMKEAESYFNA
ncbi:MAG: lysophospholipid acyltransferase family protein [Deltaproteobacteria bacterium]|nr:lysophospholipid acyltransferase family protein [Deltaproteobacteria bacterium]